MEVEGGVPLDDKAKRMRDLLSSFYSPDPSSASLPPNTSSRFATLDTINTTSFDADLYMNLLVQKSNLEGLLQKHVEMAAEIKNLDTDLQMLVYENYNKFICATDTIKRMKNNIVGMETNMEELLEKIMSVQSRSDRVNTSLFEKREHIEKLHRTRNLLRKVQFIYDLPTRLEKCIRSEAYADAVKFYTGAMPIFKAYGDSSFQDCKRASEEAMTTIIKNLQASIREFAEDVCTYKVIFLHSEQELSKLAQDLVMKHFEAAHQQIKKQVYTADLLAILRVIWTDVLLMDEVLPEASLPNFSLQAARIAVKEYISSTFNRLLLEISDALTKVQVTQKEGTEQEYSLQAAFEASKKAVIQGSINGLQDFRQLLYENPELLLKLRGLTIDWVGKGFQEFFRRLDDHFLLLSRKRIEASQDVNVIEGMQGEKIAAGLVLLLARLSLFIEQNAIPIITEEIATSFSDGGVPSFDSGPAFVPAEICRIFRSSDNSLVSSSAERFATRESQKLGFLET